MTDRKTLVGLFQPEKAAPAMATIRIQRWALLLGAYNYVIKHKSSKANALADVLSWLPVTASTPSEPAEGFDNCEYVFSWKILRCHIG